MPTPVNIKVLKGGRVRIHLFVLKEGGPISTKKSTHLMPGGKRAVELGGRQGYIACQPNRQQLTLMVGGFLQPCPCSMELTSVTCPDCQETEPFKTAEAEHNKE